ncbi:universal stress protein [Candidatus Bathyarchaeota archaeon]|nr:universal stress protein [Candidatus Bathyarchaeota archaeon]
MEKISLPQRIVVAIDGSEPSIKALNYASNLARLNKSNIFLINVVSLPPGADPGTAQVLRKELRGRSEDLLRKAGELLTTSNIMVETRSVETDQSIVMTIVDFSTRQNADLIILGTKGISGYGKMMLGSVAAGVVSFANCPVLAVR